MAPRPPDGDFLVPDGPGLTSAGVFDADGKLISYLFQTLPLPAGKHPFWLPARSYVGQTILPGSYNVRVVKGDLTGIIWAGSAIPITRTPPVTAGRADIPALPSTTKAGCSSATSRPM